MDREILFKAKRIDNGEWVEGYFAKHPKGECSISVILDKCKNPPDSDPMWQKVLISHEVDQSTVCQYTGLTDKNGKKIWENDVVKWIGKLYRVVFYESICSYVLVDLTGHWNHMEMNYGDRLECYDYEIIGNIFDNPELLEEVNEHDGE